MVGSTAATCTLDVLLRGQSRQRCPCSPHPKHLPSCSLFDHSSSNRQALMCADSALTSGDDCEVDSDLDGVEVNSVVWVAVLSFGSHLMGSCLAVRSSSRRIAVTGLLI